MSDDTNPNLWGRPMSAALAIHFALDRELPAAIRQIREPAKIISFKVGCSKRTVENARQGVCGISAENLLALAKQYPAVKKLVLRLIDAETGDDHETPAQLLERIRKMVSA